MITTEQRNSERLALIEAKLERDAYYVVEFDGDLHVWRFCRDGIAVWFRCGDEESVPFTWADRIIRKIELKEEPK